METRNDIFNELKEIAPQLASLQKVNALQAPDGYFNSFYSRLALQLKPVNAIEELKVLAPTLASLKKTEPFTVDPAYFAALKNTLVQKIRQQDMVQELAAVAPTLAGLQKPALPNVPQLYFESFANRVSGDLAANAQQVITNNTSWFDKLNELLDSLSSAVFKPRYALAFSGMATVLLVAVLTFAKMPACNDLDCKFAQLSTDEITNYLNAHPDGYSDEVFEMNIDSKSIAGTPADVNNLHAYKDALQNVDDADLNQAIAD